MPTGLCLSANPRTSFLLVLVVVGLAFLVRLSHDIEADRRMSALAVADPRVQRWVAAERGKLVKARIICDGSLGVSVLLEGRFGPDIGGVERLSRYRLVRAYCPRVEPYLYGTVTYQTRWRGGHSNSNRLNGLKAEMVHDLPALRWVLVLSNVPAILVELAGALIRLAPEWG